MNRQFFGVLALTVVLLSMFGVHGVLVSASTTVTIDGADWNLVVTATGAYPGYPKWGIGASVGLTAFYMDTPGGAALYIEKQFPVPSSSPQLSLTVWGSYDPVSVTISVNGQNLETFTPPQVQNGGNPQNKQYALSNWAGQTVAIRISQTSYGGTGTIGWYKNINVYGGSTLPPVGDIYTSIAYELLKEAVTYPLPALAGTFVGAVLDWYSDIPVAGATSVSVNGGGYYDIGQQVYIGISVWTGDSTGSFSIDIVLLEISPNGLATTTLSTTHIYDVPGGVQVNLAERLAFQRQAGYAVLVNFNGNGISPNSRGFANVFVGYRQSQQTQVTFTISVVNAYSGAAIYGASVWFDGSYVGVTDSNGNIWIRTTYPPANHLYSVSASGYQTASGTVTIGSNSGGYFTVRLYPSPSW